MNDLKKLLPWAAGCGLLLSFGAANGDTITKPHTFTAGTPAQAEEVNANLDTVYNQVNKVGAVVNIDSLNGRVGIGTAAPEAKLDVQGSVKIGYASNPCDPGSEGTLRYNPGAKEMQYCDGTSWKTLEPKIPIVWSGGCSTTATLVDQWVNYCTDVVDFNTASDYLTVAANGTVTFFQAGYYRINYFSLASGAMIQSHLLKNGQRISYTSFNNGAQGVFSVEVGRIFPFAAGDTLSVSTMISIFGFTHYAHASPNNYSGLQISYEGPLN